MTTAALTPRELALLGNSRLIADAKELVRKADEAQRKSAAKPQKLLAATHG